MGTIERLLSGKMVERGMKTSALNDILEKYSDTEKPVNIAIGIRPSGVIHLGNMATLGLSALLAYKINPILSNVIVTVCDLDMPDSADWKVNHGYIKYFNVLPSRDNSNQSLLEQAVKGITDFTSKIEGELGDVNFQFQNLSDVQRKPEFRQGLKNVLDTPGIMQEILSKVSEGKVLVHPICPNCHTSNPGYSSYSSGMISTSCSNPECDLYKKETTMDVLDTSRDLTVHFFIDPLRDTTVQPCADIHVFGGDYAEAHDCNCSSKIDKIMKVTEAASGRTPDVLIGPTFYAADGGKMSKSKNNGLSMDYLVQHFGAKEYPKRILNLLNFVVDKGFSHVDYSITKDFLF